jgi:hypothetical protein
MPRSAPADRRRPVARRPRGDRTGARSGSRSTRRASRVPRSRRSARPAPCRTNPWIP